MAYASKAGRASADPTHPRAFAVCDRCGLWTHLDQLRWQMDWRGTALANLRILVCPHCYDTPQPQLRSIVLPPDPVPVMNARTEPFFADETSIRYTSGGNTVDPITNIPIPGGDERVTQTNAPRVTQQTGEPPGGLNQTPGTDPNAPGNDDPGLPRGNDTVPETGPLT